MESSQFTDSQTHFESLKPLEVKGATCDTYGVKLYGKLHFLKRLKPEFAGDIRYQEAFRKEFETGYRLEHPNLVRYISFSNEEILMEYIDGETLTQRLATHPDYFRDRKNTDKLFRQILDVVGYLHSHQILHLDLKPDNILLTRINNDVKLVDLGCCYTDTFSDTQGRTDGFAAPEQLSGEPIDVRTDIYAIGRIVEFLPCQHIYNKVIARCTANDKTERYQSVEEILHEINHKRKYFLYIAVFISCLVALVLALSFIHQQTSQPVSQQDSASVVQKSQNDSTIQQEVPHRSEESPSKAKPSPAPNQQKDEVIQMKEDMEVLVDRAYRATIYSFCDSVFPSQSAGDSWAASSTAFHQQTIDISDRLVESYPNISESIIRQEVESRFQSLVSYVFNRMRENGTKL